MSAVQSICLLSVPQKLPSIVCASVASFFNVAACTEHSHNVAQRSTICIICLCSSDQLPLLGM